ncbi:MAG: endopeptidase La [Firmicutes bacterium]|nr:endopeptidase La [Bacillota bacterium]
MTDFMSLDFNKTEQLPMIPLRGLVVFPHMNIHFDIGRDKSLAALNFAVENSGNLFLATQKDPAVVDPKPEQVYPIGTVVKIKQVVKLSNDNMRVVIQGLYRAEVFEHLKTDKFFDVAVRPLEPIEPQSVNGEVYKRKIIEMLSDFSKTDSKVPSEIFNALFNEEDLNAFCDILTANIISREKEKLSMLMEIDTEKRVEKLCILLTAEIELYKIDRKINAKVKKSIDQNQKEYYLREQLKAISEELGDSVEEIEEYKNKIKELGLEKDTQTKVLKEVNRLHKMSSSSPEATIIRNYLDWITDLPWKATTKDNSDLSKAKKILEEDHYGLEKVKGRILEYLAVHQLTKSLNGPILCFVGPPGVGKTSICKSIARALKRKYVRMSLGGVRDEAEIRGHRKTYIGAIPGRILYHMKNAGTINPVFLFDEIDKMSSDMRGDPASAMLEVLDPEQNNAFRDHYLEVPYDLSKVMFITTANTTDTIPAPLLDRMEVINLTGYTDDEKTEIAKRYLIPKQKKINGLKDVKLDIKDNVIRSIISLYTRESGVRNLERQIAGICRKVAMKLVNKEESDEGFKVTLLNLSEYLGAAKYTNDLIPAYDEVGAATGLAWTSVGGTTLTIEVSLMKGKGEIHLTGQLGDVMKESAKTALSLIRSRAAEWDIDPKVFSENDIHIHVPEGAIPKDGPSAGITIATAILSALSGRAVHHDLAMTGEITLRGKVLPIGGLKEKTLAAIRAGVKRVIIPKDNQKDIEELPEYVKNKLQLILTDDINGVFKNSLTT